MNPEQLRQHLEPLTHQDRLRYLVDIGTRSKTEDRINPILDTLEQGDFSDRLMVLQSCYGSYDSNRVIKALTDASRGVRSLAMRLLPLVADDSQLQIVLNTATFKQRRYLFTKLLKRCRYSCIDLLIDRLANIDRQQFALLLPYSSGEIVDRQIETVIDFYGTDEWRLLARRHPTIVGRLLEKQANAANDFDPRLTYQINTVLSRLADFSPEIALSICQAGSRTIPLSKLSLQPLALRLPKEVADLILNSDSTPNISFDRVVDKLDISQLLGLLTNHRATVNPRTFLRFLSPSKREIIYDRFVDRWRDTEGCLTADLISNFPRHIREREAYYHLNLPALTTRPSQRLPYAAFLPWEEARKMLEPFMRNPDPDLRAISITVLIANVRYNRAHRGEILSIAKRIRNEQDPIRGAMLGGLAALPPMIWEEEYLDDLSQVINDALNAADLSYSTASFVERLVIAILPFHPDWAAQQLAALVQHRGQISFYNLEQRLSDADVSKIAPFLLPVLESWRTRERENYIISAAQSLGRRLRVFDALVYILEQVINDTYKYGLASSALDLISKYRRDRFIDLAPQLLQKDPSWITQYTVYNFVHRHRQDLLNPFLGQRAYRGRFSTGKTRFLLPMNKGFSRWSTIQQRIFAKALCEVTQDTARDLFSIIRVIDQLAALPAVPPTRLIELASHLNSNLAIRDTALRSLSHLDNDLGIPILIESMGDDRARIAIYALRRTLLELPVDRSLAMLRNVPLEKVTVAKEVVRLLGELPTEPAYQELLTWDNRDLHRDVRVAFLRALWRHLEREETWIVFTNAAISDDAAIATIVARIPTDRLSPIAQSRLLILLSTLLIHPDPLVRLNVLQRCYELPINDPDRIILPKLLQAINSHLPDECSAAANALFNTYSGKLAHAIGDGIESFIGNRRALQTAIDILINTLSWRQSQLLPTARAVIESMESDPLTRCLQVKLAVAALPGAELATFLQKLVEAEQMHPEVLWSAVTSIERVTSTSDASELVRLEEILSVSSDDRLRRIALAALIAQSQADGWNDDRQQRLYAWRNDPSAMVAEKAQFTFAIPIDTNPGTVGAGLARTFG
jgi:hypothetical protein